MEALPISTSHRKWIRSLHRKKIREKEGVFIAEGFHALEGAVKAGFHPIVEVITDRHRHEAVTAALPRDLPVYECPGSVMEEISTEKTPQGVIIICRRRAFDFHSLEETASDTLLYLDRVSDPGNLGTIVRTAAWFGVGQVLLSPSCVDPFNTKTIRASAGTIFRTEIYQDADSEIVQRFAEKMDYRLLAMVPRGGLSPDKVGSGKTIVMLGQEASGLSEELKRHADQSITIPGQGTVESLNLSVAAAIILYEITKRV